jgi:uncharacterized protein (DUF305 family)
MEIEMLRVRNRVVLAQSVLLITLMAAGCGDGSSTNPVGPRAMAGQGMGNNGIGNNGMGMWSGSEFDYLTQMIPHHEEAIEAAQVLERGTGRNAMRRFARMIVETQTAEVNQMRRWLAARYAGRDTRVAYRPMMRDLSALRGDALDRAFLDDMIPHHQMAVMMSQRLLMSGVITHRDVIPFAETIRDVQTAEIRMMVSWLAEWFGASPGMGH